MLGAALERREPLSASCCLASPPVLLLLPAAAAEGSPGLSGYPRACAVAIAWALCSSLVEAELNCLDLPLVCEEVLRLAEGRRGRPVDAWP